MNDDFCRSTYHGLLSITILNTLNFSDKPIKQNLLVLHPPHMTDRENHLAESVVGLLTETIEQSLVALFLH